MNWLKRLLGRLMGNDGTIAAAIHSTWSARGRMPSIQDIEDVLAQGYEAGRKAGAVEIVNRLRQVMKYNYADDHRRIHYFEAVEMVIAVCNNEAANIAGEPVKGRT